MSLDDLGAERVGQHDQTGQQVLGAVEVLLPERDRPAVALGLAQQAPFASVGKQTAKTTGNTIELHSRFESAIQGQSGGSSPPASSA